MGKWRRCVLSALVGLSLVGIALAQVGQTTRDETPLDQFLKLDANGDGSVDRAEVADSARPAFDRLLERGDADRDGKLDAKEYQAVIGGLRAFEEGLWKKTIGILKAMDRDRDGRVSRREFTGARSQFDELDGNEDGYITLKEIVAAAQAKPPTNAGARQGRAAGLMSGG
jgi:Ca2+-binding EF-hand superfamily protein